jgi:hypothetical protein
MDTGRRISATAHDRAPEERAERDIEGRFERSGLFCGAPLPARV